MARPRPTNKRLFLHAYLGQRVVINSLKKEEVLINWDKYAEIALKYL